MRRTRNTNEAGATLPELMMTALVMAVFFASIFEVGAVCLRYISATKENVAAIECVEDRLEQLRALDFSDLTNPTFLAVAPAKPAASPSPSPPQRRNLTTPSNSSELAQQATETVRISTFSGTTATTPRVTFTRGPGAKISATPFSDTDVTPTTTWEGGSTLSSATAVQIDVTYTWKATLGGRQRTESSSTIIAQGAKK